MITKRNENMNNQSGQALVENMFVILLLIFCSYAIIEVTRLMAFKSYLQAITADAVRQISFSHLSLKREGQVSTENENRSLLIANIKTDIEKKLQQFHTSLLSFDKSIASQSHPFLFLKEHKISLDLMFINENNKNNKNPAGVYLKINSCFPVLFSGYFRNFQRNRTELPEIGKKVAGQEQEQRNCLGQYTSSKIFTPLFWFRVRSAAFFPWPVSTALFEKGMVIPENYPGIEKKYRDDVLNTLEKIDLSSFLKKRIE
ncbi:TadE/TadG family type IV pilus assembly protein [Silvanigrella aquatica]|uniref:Uncharacterized protein n=1 Tax=Silvanigrella aquatica TaxID=1915309 RepID=A0A1L4D1J5_9BACT|nr:hypothetical protein [Silvanigrella aquatica]APJ04072.1 hypothetical protein AXG55_09200 [Silvanigrella aquatica]